MNAIFHRLRLILLVGGVVLACVASLELLRAYQTLSALHPWVGLAFVGLLLAFVIWVGVMVARMHARYPRALLPPQPLPESGASNRAIRRQATYLCAVMRRLAGNLLLDPPDREALLVESDLLTARFLRSASLPTEAVQELETCVDSQITPHIEKLDRLAEESVRGCVATVMLGVTISPWRSADLIIVIQRNVAMIARVMDIYHSRPRARDQLRVLGDVVAVVAVVQYLNLGTKLCEKLLAKVPVVGRFIDDIAQGVGASLMTSVAGHAAMDRCRSFSGWNRDLGERAIREHLKEFYRDVRTVLFDDVLKQLSQRIRAEASRSREDPDQAESRFADSMAAAMDETGADLDSFIRPHVIVRSAQFVTRSAGWAGRTVKRSVTGTGRVLTSGANAVGQGTVTTLKATGRGVVGAVDATGRGIKATGKGLVHATSQTARFGVNGFKQVARPFKKKADDPNPDGE